MSTTRTALAAAVLLVTAPRPALAARLGFSFEAAGGLHRESGRVVPAPAHPGVTVSPDLELGMATVFGRFRPTVFSRVTVSNAERPVHFEGMFGGTVTFRTVEPAFGAGLVFEPDTRRRWFVRGDVYPFFAILVNSGSADVEVKPWSTTGIGFRGSAGTAFGPLVLSLVGEYDYWALRTRVAKYAQTGWWNRVKVGEQEVDFSTSVFRLGVCVGARIALDDIGRRRLW